MINLFFFPGVGFIVRVNTIKDKVFDGTQDGLRNARVFANKLGSFTGSRVEEDTSVKWALSNKSYCRKPTKSVTIFAEPESDGKIRLVAKDGTRIVMVLRSIIQSNAPERIEYMRNSLYDGKMLPKLDSSATRIIRKGRLGGQLFGPVRQNLENYESI